MASYVLLLKPGFDGPHVDSLLDVSGAVVPGVTFKEWLTTARVIDRLNGSNDEEVKARKELLHQVSMLDLRSRLDGACDGPYLLHSEHHLTYEQLERMVNTDSKFVKRLREKGRL